MRKLAARGDVRPELREKHNKFLHHPAQGILRTYVRALQVQVSQPFASAWAGQDRSVWAGQGFPSLGQTGQNDAGPG